MNDDELKALIKKTRNHMYEAQRIHALICKICADRGHNITKGKFGGASCSICGEGFGWWCDKNPNNPYCEYYAGSEDCKYCGQPDERK